MAERGASCETPKKVKDNRLIVDPGRTAAA
jgi:hypothetical protein